MLDVVYQLTQIFICFFEAYLMFDFYQAFFQRKRIFSARITPVFIILLEVICIRSINSFGKSEINIILMPIAYMVMVLIFFDGSLLKKVLCCIIAASIMFGTEFLFMLIMSHSSDSALNEMQTSQEVMVLIMVAMKLFTFIMFNVVKKIVSNNGRQMSIKVFLQYIILPISTMGLIIAIAYTDIDYEVMTQVRNLMIISAALALCGNVLIFYAFEKHAAFMEKLKEQEVTITKMSMDEKYFLQIQEIQQEHAILLHDVHHNLRVIAELAAEEKSEHILSIVSELKNEFSNSKEAIYSQNKLLNIILHDKRKEAERNKVSIEITIEPLFNIEHLTDIDMIALVSNILENAIEAAAKCSGGYVKVFMYMQNDNKFAVIKVINNFNGNINVKKGMLKTTKDDMRGHGLGIASINHIAEKYGGFFESKYENNIFQAMAVISSDGKRQ